MTKLTQPTPTVPDPTSIATWPAAFVAVALILALLVLPSVLAYLSNARVKQVANTLENTNDGSTVRDSLNRIESDMSGVRVDVAEVAVEVGRLRREFDDHRATKTPGAAPTAPPSGYHDDPHTPPPVTP